MKDYYCIADYVFPDDVDEYDNCPKCKLKPKVWIFDNGQSTACGCHDYNQYEHFSIRAESINSHYKRFKTIVDFPDGLKDNWNTWCKTGEITFINNYNESGIW